MSHIYSPIDWDTNFEQIRADGLATLAAQAERAREQRRDITTDIEIADRAREDADHE